MFLQIIQDFSDFFFGLFGLVLDIFLCILPSTKIKIFYQRRKKNPTVNALVKNQEFLEPR